MKTLHFSILVILLVTGLFGMQSVFAQNATNSTYSIPPNAIRTPNGGWVTPFHTTENGQNLTLHYETGTQVSNSYLNPGPPPDPIFLVDNRNQIDNFLTNHEILIHYDVNVGISGSSPLDLEIKLVNGNNLIFDDKKHLTLNDTHSTVLFWRFVPALPGNYAVEKYSNGILTSTASFTVFDSKETLSSPVLVSPLKQMQAQIPISAIQCESTYNLVIKSEDGSAACVKLDTAYVLIKRGWADKPNSLQEQLDMANSCIGMTDACKHRYDVNNNPFGITALIIYQPPDVCLNPASHSIPYGMPSCPPNKFYLKINSNSTTYLMGYNICDGNSCATNNNLSLILPLKSGLNPDYQMVGLPVNLQWKYGDTVRIQLYVSPTNNNKTASLVDLGNSAIVP